MIGQLRDFFRVLGLPTQALVIILAATVGLTLTEGAGIGSLLPILDFIDKGSEGLTSGPSRAMVRALAWLGLAPTLPTLLGAALLPLILRQGFLTAQQWGTASAQYRTEAAARHRLARLFAHAPLGFFIEHDQGQLTSSTVTECSRCGIVVMAAVMLVTASALMLVYFALLMLVSWQLTVIAVPVFGVAAILFNGSVRRSHGLGRRYSDALADLSKAVSEIVHGIRLIKLRHMEDQVLVKADGAIEDMRRNFVRDRVTQSRSSNAIQPVLIALVFALLFVAVRYLHESLANLGIFLFILTRLIPLVTQINTSRMQVAGAIQGFHHLQALAASAESSPAPKSGPLPFVGLKTAIAFAQVRFRYSPDLPIVLNDLTFEIRRGQMVALVGASGSGKSTTVDLLARFHEPESGTILIDGIAIDQYDLADYHRHIALVSQDHILFNDTLRANLTFGAADTPDDDLERVLRDAHAWEFVAALPEGLSTLVGEHGFRLSGGQRQRLSLARALLQRPDILILDEPTSALDSVSEAAIHDSLDRLRGTITILIIAHRLATIRSADWIAVMAEGRVVEQGFYSDLIARPGPFRRLHEAQQLS